MCNRGTEINSMILLCTYHGRRYIVFVVRASYAAAVVVVVAVVHFNNNNNNIYIHIVTSRLYRRESYTLRSYVAAWNTRVCACVVVRPSVIIFLNFFLKFFFLIYIIYLYSISSTLDRDQSYTNRESYILI